MRFLISSLIIVAYFRLAFCEVNPTIISMESQINQLKKELAQIQIERQKNIDESKKDKAEVEAYRIRMQKRFSQMNAETEIIKNNSLQEKIKKDSLLSLIETEKQHHAQRTSEENIFRTKLIELTQMVSKSARNIAPLVNKVNSSSLSLLINELTTKSIDNIEGMNRLNQIMNQIYESTTSIQVSQESSPSADLTGTTYRLRIGSMYESAVDMKGEKMVVWNGVDSSGNYIWERVNNFDFAALMLKAVQIREGKSLPSFANVYFSKKIILGEK